MRGGWVALVSVVCLGCSELPPLAVDSCGNGVVEPGAGEDCDGQVAAPAGCFQCRFVCEDGASCPAGYQCGSDGVCRTPSQTFVTASQLPGVARELLTGDIDGDRRFELVQDSAPELSVYYFDSEASPELVQRADGATSVGVNPVLGEFSDDPWLDGLIPVGIPELSGFVFALGNAERVPVIRASPSLAVPAEVSKIAVIPLELFEDVFGDEVLVLAEISGAAGLAYLTGQRSASFDVLGVAPHGADRLAGRPLVGDLDLRPSSPCEDLVLPYQGDDQLFVLSPCRLGANQVVELNAFGAPTLVKLPSGAVVEKQAALLDLNSDGLLDLVVAVRRGPQREIDVAYGVGDGSFHSDPAALPASSGNNQASTYYSLGVSASPIIALGDLNGDAVVDYVDSRRVHVSNATSPLSYRDAAIAYPDAWSEALIADLNDNGLNDLFTVTENGKLAGFYNSSPDGRLGLFEIPSGGRVSQLLRGDFDGDLINDVASVVASDQFGDSLSIFFGAKSGGPSAPVSAGQLGEIQQVARLSGALGDFTDAADDLTVLSANSDGSLGFSVFAGRGDRALGSPYFLNNASATAVTPFTATLAAAGNFDADAHLDFAALGLAEAEFRLFLTPLRAQANINPSLTRSSPALPDVADWSRALMVAIDLDPDGVDEVVLMAPSAAQGGVTLVARARPDADGVNRFEFDAELSTPHLAAAVERGFGLASRIVAEDLDADGAAELLVLAEQPEPDGALRQVILVYWNARNGQLSAPLSYVAPEGDVLALTLLNADGDAAPEVAYLAAGAAHLANVHVGNRTLSHARSAILDTPQANMIAAGDLNGDGVDDLITSGADGTQVHVGRAVVQ